MMNTLKCLQNVHFLMFDISLIITRKEPNNKQSTWYNKSVITFQKSHFLFTIVPFVRDTVCL